MLSYPVLLARVVQDKWSITSRTQLETTTQNLLDAGIKRVNWCKEHDRLEATQATQWDEAAELPHQNGVLSIKLCISGSLSRLDCHGLLTDY